METSGLTALLGDTWFGATLPVTARARLAAVGTIVDLREGTVVIREGLLCEVLGIVLDGRIAIRFQAGQFEMTRDDTEAAFAVITEIARAQT